jgi:hypothetical protein
LSSRKITIAWLLTVGLMAVFAGMSWINLELSPEAGAQKFEISGFQIFPIISALMLLQVASLLATLLTRQIVARAISGLLAPIMLAHGLFVFFGLPSNIQNAIEVQITEITGVSGFASQAEFVEFAGETFLWTGYLLAVTLNFAVLLAKAISKSGSSKAKASKEVPVSELDLWETQK